MRQPTMTLNATPPDFGTASAATPRNGGVRFLSVIVALQATVAVAAEVQLQVEDSTNAGTYTTVAKCGLPIGVVTAHSLTLSWPVPAGHKYKLVRTGGEGVTEAVSSMHYIDI